MCALQLQIYSSLQQAVLVHTATTGQAKPSNAVSRLSNVDQQHKAVAVAAKQGADMGFLLVKLRGGVTSQHPAGKCDYRR